MEIIISESPVKFYNVLGCDMIRDPRHDFFSTISFPAIMHYKGCDPELSGDAFYERELAKVRNTDASPIKISPMDPMARSDAGAIYLYASLRDLRSHPASAAIILRLTLAADPKIHVDLCIYPRAVGYELDPGPVDLLVPMAWLIGMPSMTKGEIDVPDYVNRLSIVQLSYEEA